MEFSGTLITGWVAGSLTLAGLLCTGSWAAAGTAHQTAGSHHFSVISNQNRTQRSRAFKHLSEMFHDPWTTNRFEIEDCLLSNINTHNKEFIPTTPTMNLKTTVTALCYLSFPLLCDASNDVVGLLSPPAQEPDTNNDDLATEKPVFISFSAPWG